MKTLQSSSSYVTKHRLSESLDGLMQLFRERVLPFDTDAARKYAELAITDASRPGRPSRKIYIKIF